MLNLVMLIKYDDLTLKKYTSGITKHQEKIRLLILKNLRRNC